MNVLSRHQIAAVLLFLASAGSGYSQSQVGTIKGKVTDTEDHVLPYATVTLKNTSYGANTDAEGYFVLKSVAPGEYVLEASFVGYSTQHRTIILKADQTLELNFNLPEDSQVLESVEVTGKTESQEVREQAYAVTSIDTRRLLNSSVDLNQVLNRTAGVRIREDGGMGSNFNFSLNGFSGNQVKFFLDGIPMDNFGSSLTLNNIPVNLAERIEVYKGVVPVSLGSDALGGAVNVITNQHVKNYLDVSYSFGSFNTHRAAVISRTTNASAVVINANAFYNHADNNYWVDVQIPDANTGKIDGYERVRRFHDGYRSATVQVEAGVTNKKYADRLFIGLIASGNKKETQTGINMTQVAGQVYTTDEVLMPTLKFRKDSLFSGHMSVNLYASYNFREAVWADTSSRIYDWRGDYKLRAVDALAGELSWDKTLFKFKDRSSLAVVNLSYTLNDRHSFSFNNTFSRYSRVGEDPISYTAVPFSSPNILTKNISGLSYRLDLLDKRWSTTIFTKAFMMNADVYAAENSVDDTIENIHSDFTRIGVGMASTYFVRPWWQLKVSFENTYRFPDGYEMFGDGLLLEANPFLKPEKSKNLNVGFLLNRGSGRHRFLIEGNYIYRLPDEMIRLSAQAVTSIYVNLRSARISSIEGGVKYQYNGWLNAELNGTYQSIINTNKYDNGHISVVYLDQLPNIPLFFGNASVGAQFKNVALPDSKLAIDWSLLFVEAFYLKWPSQGTSDTKKDIPRQISHDLSLTYSLKNGKYNLSLACLNVTDTKRYDNFMLQKPGRNFSVKARFFISR